MSAGPLVLTPSKSAGGLAVKARDGDKGSRVSVKPVLFGYLRVRVGASSGEEARGRRELAAFAAQEGFTLAEIFVDANENRPDAGLAHLIRVARRCEGAAVAVPHLGHLGSEPLARQEMRRRLERESSARLLIVQESQ